MKLALAHCWKEWRAQRGLLIAYSLLVFTCLCLGFLLVPEHWWLDEGRSPMALSWFVAAGAIGVFAFVAPNLVRAEFAGKDDQFVRRLPGALVPSFHGKLLFLVLCAAALPLLGLCCGELFLTAIAQPWHELFPETGGGSLAAVVPWPAVCCAYAMLLAPWVWAIGTWLPGGRMAVGGVLLFVLLLGLLVAFAVMAPSPAILEGIAWQAWLWAVAPLGAIVAGVSWIFGRRGGGAFRSARFGLAATAVGLVPPSLWFADCAWHYHRPDLQRLATLEVEGLSPDGRFVLARGAEHGAFHTVSLRIDLHTGEAEQLTDIWSAFGTELVRPHPGRHGGRLRYWRLYGDRALEHRVLDLTTGETTQVGYDEKHKVLLLPPELRSKVFAEARETTPLRAPGGLRVWGEEGVLCFEEADGTVSRQPWPGDWHGWFAAAWHGFHVYGHALFDLTSRESRGKIPGRLVRGTVLVGDGTSSDLWMQQDVGGEKQPCEALAGSRLIGLLDDDHVLAARVASGKGQVPRLFLYRPADRTTTELRIPDGVQFDAVLEAAPFGERRAYGSLLTRDPVGRIWLRCSGRTKETFLLLDTTTLELTAVLPCSRPESMWPELLDWPDARTVLVSQGAQILRIDINTGKRTVLFPRGTP